MYELIIKYRIPCWKLMSISCCPNPPKRLPPGDRFHAKPVHTILATFSSSTRKSTICPMFAAMTHAQCPPLFREWTCGRDLTQQPSIVIKSYDLLWLHSPVSGPPQSRISLGVQKPMIEETGPARNIRVNPTLLDHVWVL